MNFNDAQFKLTRTLAVLLFTCGGLNASLAAQTGWQFDTSDRDQPELSYMENGTNVFDVGCGRAFAIHVVYPRSPKKIGAKVAIVLSNSVEQMTLKGEIESPDDDDRSGKARFLQWDLGFKRQDPELFGDRWKKIEDQLLDLLDSGKPLKVSAEGRSYELPAPDAKDWKKRFKEKC